METRQNIACNTEEQCLMYCWKQKCPGCVSADPIACVCHLVARNSMIATVEGTSISCAWGCLPGGMCCAFFGLDVGSNPHDKLRSWHVSACDATWRGITKSTPSDKHFFLWTLLAVHRCRLLKHCFMYQPEESEYHSRGSDNHPFQHEWTQTVKSR